MKDLKLLKRMQENSKNPIMLVPTRKSYLDMLLIGYIIFANGMKQPYFSTPSQYLEVRIINRMLKSLGSFYVQEDNTKPLYETVLKEYISILMVDKQMIVAPIEDSRSKSGMIGKVNSRVFNYIMNTFLTGRVQDIDIIPVTINYDRILEGETFPFELVGEDKVKESLSRFLLSARHIGKHFGKVCVNFGTKISARDYFEQ